MSGRRTVKASSTDCSRCCIPMDRIQGFRPKITALSGCTLRLSQRECFSVGFVKEESSGAAVAVKVPTRPFAFAFLNPPIAWGDLRQVWGKTFEATALVEMRETGLIGTRQREQYYVLVLDAQGIYKSGERL